MRTFRKLPLKAFNIKKIYLEFRRLDFRVFLQKASKYLINCTFMICLFCIYIQGQDTVKIIRMKDYPIVVGSLNGKKAFFLVDSGANITILNINDVKRYKIKYSKSISKVKIISGLTANQREILVATNTSLYLGNRKIEACFKLLDLSNLKDSIGASNGVWINGIIGSDLMKKYKFTIDYGNQEIRFDHTTSYSKTCL